MCNSLRNPWIGKSKECLTPCSYPSFCIGYEGAFIAVCILSAKSLYCQTDKSPLDYVTHRECVITLQRKREGRMPTLEEQLEALERVQSFMKLEQVSDTRHLNERMSALHQQLLNREGDSLNTSYDHPRLSYRRTVSK